MLDILNSEKNLISAVLAAKKTGYSSDYIGQLARAKKIPAQLVGRSWYVDLQKLVEYKKLKRSSPQHANSIALPNRAGLRHDSNFRVVAHLMYEADRRPLLPTLLKVKPRERSRFSHKLVREISVITISILAAVSIAIFALEENNPILANALERNISMSANTLDPLLTGFSDLKDTAMKTFPITSP